MDRPEELPVDPPGNGPPDHAGGPPPWLPIDIYETSGNDKFLLEPYPENPDMALIRVAKYSPENGERVPDKRTTISKQELENQKAYLEAELAQVETLLAAFAAQTKPAIEGM